MAEGDGGGCQWGPVGASGGQRGPYGKWQGRSTFVLLFVDGGPKKYLFCEIVFNEDIDR